MTKPARGKFFFGLGVALAAGALLLAVTIHVQASSPPEETDWSLVETSAASATVPLPNQDPCLHCHILGENKNLWMPLARWTVFGTLGLVFVFGVYRSASVWKQRKPWKPLTARAVEWVDERYEVSAPLSKILS